MGFEFILHTVCDNLVNISRVFAALHMNIFNEINFFAMPIIASKFKYLLVNIKC